MKVTNIYKLIGVTGLVCIFQTACTKLDTKTYSVTPADQFWQTEAQIAAGEAPAYQQLQNIVNLNGNVMEMIEPCTDEMLTPTRGGDWGDAGHWDALFYHTWPASNPNWDNGWQAIFTGVSKCNLIINDVKALSPQPANANAIYAGLKTLRAYYYYMAMDVFGNVPILTDTTTVSNIPNSPRATVYNWIVSELKSNAQYLPSNVDATTYGFATKYFAYALLARLYLNQQVFAGNFSSLPATPGTADWQDCISYCDSVLAGPFALTTSSYFDNFSSTNGPQITENIFCVPYDATNIQGNSPQMTTLHYNNNQNLNLSVNPWNGFCATADFYYQYDTSSTYSLGATTTTRTFNDQRTGQWLVGAQFASTYQYPPNANVLVASTDPSKPQIIDNHTTDTLLYFNPVVSVFSNPNPGFHGAGVRNVKYWPGGQGQNLSNDVVVFRLADIMLMKAEALLRTGDAGDAQPLLDAVRARAYGSNPAPPLPATLANVYWERARELAWEGVRREDMIRYEMATNLQTPYFSQGYGNSNPAIVTNSPYKAQDPMDGHLFIFPIPSLELTANSALTQNPGYK
jgi:hypothetical protein